jgi:formyltetrahydrofolate deformylase
MTSHILLTQCPDERGLIYKVTNVLYRLNLNIVSNSEFVERQHEQFFMRTEFSGELDADQLLYDLREVLPGAVQLKLSPNRKKDIVILATKEHHCLGDLLLRWSYNELHANIKAVISNYDHLEDLVKKFGLPFHHVGHESLTREEHEERLLQVINEYDPEFIVLAKYMRILSSQMVSSYPNRIINIHHSFLPAFIGANPYVKAYERGVKIIGATAHFVSNDLDEGPIISQHVIPVNHSHSAKDMAQAGRDVEKIVLANALQLVFNERVFVYRNKTIIFD